MKLLLFILFFFCIILECLAQNYIKLPEPVIGWDSLQNKLTYPEIAKRALVWGAYDVHALIDSTGKLIHINIFCANYEALQFMDQFKSFDSLFFKYIENELQDLKWNPGLMYDKPETMNIVIPIVYYFDRRIDSSPILFIKTEAPISKSH